jgi:hypothetical protein
MGEILFYPLGSMILTLALFLSYYALRFKVEVDEPDDMSLIHRYEMIEAWENMVDDEPSNEVLCGLVDRKIDFETVHGDVLIAYDYINGTFNYWTDRKDSVTYQMLLDIAREYSVKVGVKRVFLIDEPAGVSDNITPLKVKGHFLKPKMRTVNVTVKLNSFKYKGDLMEGKDSSTTDNSHISVATNCSWNEWKSKNV